jgi:hypothetical protein
MPHSSSEEDEGYPSTDDDDASSGLVGNSGTLLVVWLDHTKSACDVAYYLCPYVCSLRFPVLGFQSSAARDHVRRYHLNYVPYRCFAVPSSGHTTTTTHPPALKGTCMTPTLLSRHKASARRLARDIPGKNKDRVFAYVDVTLTETNSHLYACGYCAFADEHLLAYKRHVVSQHVEFCFALPPSPGGSVFPVLGSPVRC